MSRSPLRDSEEIRRTLERRGWKLHRLGVEPERDASEPDDHDRVDDDDLAPLAERRQDQPKDDEVEDPEELEPDDELDDADALKDDDDQAPEWIVFGGEVQPDAAWNACQTNRGAPELALPVDGTISLKNAN